MLRCAILKWPEVLRASGNHQTPVLKSTDLTNMAPEIAAQYYRTFAKDRLVEAPERHVWAAISSTATENAWRSKPPKMRSSARCCWRNRSRVIVPRSRRPRITRRSANQLGYFLLLLDHLMLPKWRSSIASRFNRRPVSIGILAELHRRSGDTAGQQWHTAIAAIDQRQSTLPAIPMVQQVTQPPLHS